MIPIRRLQYPTGADSQTKAGLTSSQISKRASEPGGCSTERRHSWYSWRSILPAVAGSEADGVVPSYAAPVDGAILLRRRLSGVTSHSGRRWIITCLVYSRVNAITTFARHKYLIKTHLYIGVRDEMMRAAVSLLYYLVSPDLVITARTSRVNHICTVLLLKLFLMAFLYLRRDQLRSREKFKRVVWTDQVKRGGNPQTSQWACDAGMVSSAADGL